MNITTTTGPVTVLAIKGDVDGSNFYQLVDAAERAFSAGGTQMVVDMSGVGLITSAGLVALQTLSARAASLGGKVVLCAPRDNVYQVLRMTGYTYSIGVYPDLATATAGLAGA
jgi:stage II sporulation protein AA (anti-sigma F factor antagonist)